MSILFAQAQPIPLHAVAAMAAIILGGVQFYMKKGGILHKLIGRTWIGLMVVVSVSSFLSIKWNYGGPIARYIC